MKRYLLQMKDYCKLAKVLNNGCANHIILKERCKLHDFNETAHNTKSFICSCGFINKIDQDTVARKT